MITERAFRVREGRGLLFRLNRSGVWTVTPRTPSGNIAKKRVVHLRNSNGMDGVCIPIRGTIRVWTVTLITPRGSIAKEDGLLTSMLHTGSEE